MDVEMRFIWDGKVMLSYAPTCFQRGWLLCEREIESEVVTGGFWGLTERWRFASREIVRCAPGINSCRKRRGQDWTEREIKQWCIETEASVKFIGALWLGGGSLNLIRIGERDQDLIPIPSHWIVSLQAVLEEGSDLELGASLQQSVNPNEGLSQELQLPTPPVVTETNASVLERRSEQYIHDRGEGHLQDKPIHKEPCRQRH